MKKTLTLIGRTLLCGILLCASIAFFMVAVVTIDTNPVLWLVSCIISVASFVTAIGISLGVFEHDTQAAPKAQTRSEYEPETANLKTA